MRQRGLLLAAIVGSCLLLGWSAPAQAYPHWQFTSGATRCNQCHFSPGGGGLITGYARDAVGDELSTWKGNGDFLHGGVTLPAWLSLGGDFRGAFLAKDVQDPGGARRAIFPMQADLAARVALGAGFSFIAAGGMRGQVRKNEDIVPFQNYQPISTSRLISREHYLLWQPTALGWYGRAGRFYAPFGLRLAEHVTYIRRDLGFNQLEESYNLSGGYVAPQWELHITAFAPDFLRHIGSNEKGVAGYLERRLGDRAAIAVQGKYAVGEGVTRSIGGAVGKFHVEAIKTLFFAEADLVLLTFDRLTFRNQFVGAAGASALPVPGLVLTVLGERFAQDLEVRDSAWNAATALVGWFPYPHTEVQLMARAQFPAGGDTAKTLLLQLHYFL